MYRIVIAVMLVVLFGSAQAETVKGRIAVVSKQAGTIQLEVKGKDKSMSKVVVRTDANTRYEGAAGLNDLGPPDLVEVQREPGKPASSIKKIVFGLPPGVEIGVKELVGIMTGGGLYHLYRRAARQAFRRRACARREVGLSQGQGFPRPPAGRQERDVGLLLRRSDLPVYRCRGEAGAGRGLHQPQGFPGRAAGLEEGQAAGACRGLVAGQEPRPATRDPRCA